MNMPEAFREISRKARKEHRCCECRKTIAKTETYIYSSGIWEDGPDSYKTCEKCYKIKALAVNKYPPDNEDEGPAFGELRDYIYEMASIGRRGRKQWPKW